MNIGKASIPKVNGWVNKRPARYNSTKQQVDLDANVSALENGGMTDNNISVTKQAQLDIFSKNLQTESSRTLVYDSGEIVQRIGEKTVFLPLLTGFKSGNSGYNSITGNTLNLEKLDIQYAVKYADTSIAEGVPSAIKLSLIQALTDTVPDHWAIPGVVDSVDALSPMDPLICGEGKLFRLMETQPTGVSTSQNRQYTGSMLSIGDSNSTVKMKKNTTSGNFDASAGQFYLCVSLASSDLVAANLSLYATARAYYRC